MLAEPASTGFGKRARLRPGSAPRRGCGEIEVVLRAGRRRVLSLDDGESNPRVFRLVSAALESRNRSRFAEAFPVGQEAKGQSFVKGPEDAVSLDNCDLSGTGVAGAGRAH